MFEKSPTLPPDPILSVKQAFDADQNPKKIDLGVGIYRDESGVCPMMPSVRQAEVALMAEEYSKAYVGVRGNDKFLTLVQEMIFKDLAQTRPIFSIQGLGGTGSLRVIFDTIAELLAGREVILTKPTWPNHKALFSREGFKLTEVDYDMSGDAEAGAQAFIAGVKACGDGGAIVLHGCCHNPTGLDLPESAYGDLIETLRAKNIFPILDLAYFGFARGFDQDTSMVRAFHEAGLEYALAFSCSKSFGLYRERVGAAYFVGNDAQHVRSLGTLVVSKSRANYSMPPDFGAALVAGLLSDTALTAQWKTELTGMRDRLTALRGALIERFDARNIPQQFSASVAGYGLFSLLPLKPEEVKALAEQHSIYMPSNGRINLSGLTEQTIPTVCDALTEVVRS